MSVAGRLLWMKIQTRLDTIWPKYNISTRGNPICWPHFNNLDGQRYERAAIDRLNIRVVLGGSETIIGSGDALG